MGKLMIILGVVLMIASMGILFFFIAGTDNPATAEILESLHCKQGETIVQHLGAYSYSPTSGGGRSVTYGCQIEPGQERDVTGPVVLTLIAGFTIPFLSGLFLLMFGIFRSVWKFTRGITQGVTQYAMKSGTTFPNPVMESHVIDLRGNQNWDNADIPPQAKQVIDNLFGNMAQMGTTMAAGNSTSVNLSDKLAQLDEARNKGLINDIEYQQARKAILDNFDG